MKLMIRLSFALLAVLLLAGCAAVPKPHPVPHKAHPLVKQETAPIPPPPAPAPRSRLKWFHTAT